MDFQPDGALRDIYVLDTTLDDWDVAFRFLVDSYAHQLTSGNPEQAFPASASDVFHQQETGHRMSLHLDVGGVLVNCHFFSPDEIELDLDPSDVSNQETYQSVLRLVMGLAAAVGKRAILTHENTQEAVILAYEPASGTTQVFPPHTL
jgi:hypothetical protein